MLDAVTAASPSRRPWLALITALVVLGVARPVSALPVREPSFRFSQSVSYSSKYKTLRSLEAQERVSRVPETRIRDFALRPGPASGLGGRLKEELIRVFGLVYGGNASGGLDVGNNPINRLDPRGTGPLQVVNLGFFAAHVGSALGNAISSARLTWAGQDQAAGIYFKQAEWALGKAALDFAGTFDISDSFGGLNAGENAVQVVAMNTDAAAALQGALEGGARISSTGLDWLQMAGSHDTPDPTGIGPGWDPKNVNDPKYQFGCERVAQRIEDLIGGKQFTIRPKGGLPSLGEYRGRGFGWASHTVVLKDGRVFDAFTGAAGVSLDEFRSLWKYADDIDFGGLY